MLALKGVALVAIIIAATVITVVAVVPADMPPENSPELTADVPSAALPELTPDEKATEFLSSVVGLNLAEYALVFPTPPPGYDAESWAERFALKEAEALSRNASYPPELCGIVKQETSSFDFEADGNKITTNGIFLNGQIGFFKIYTTSGTYIYSEPPATDLLSQAKTILQRYRAYAARVYGTNNSYLEPMQNILNSINHLSPMNVTVGNINFQISESEGKTLIQWIYTENGVSMKYKRLALAFRNNAFESIIDNWRIYSVGGFSVINAEEAYNLALETAQNCEFRIVNEDVNEVVTLPDLSDSVYQMYFTMVPYRNNSGDIPSNITRDPLTLYPYWQFYFYFKGGEIGGYSGVQVGIWGDTKEISYCSGFGFYGWHFSPD
jgi:hypothetical protein